MAGYHNYSMSNNAVAAYENGEKPLSKWTKAAIIAAADEYLTEAEDEQRETKLAWLRAASLAKLKDFALQRSSWHHTSCRYNTTDFFSISERMLDAMTAEDAVELLAKDEKPAPVAPARRPGVIEWLEWSGTRRHPKATERKLDGVEIEEKGAFYLVYKGGEFVFKKKIGSNGTFVKYL